MNDIQRACAPTRGVAIVTTVATTAMRAPAVLTAFLLSTGPHTPDTWTRRPASRLGRQAMFRCELVQIRVGARQVMRNLSLRPRYFNVDRTGIQGDLIAGVELEVTALDVWLGEINRVGDDTDPGEDVADADEVLAQRRLLTARYAVAPQYPVFMCVVSTVRTSPSQRPVENPSQVRARSAPDGDVRPSRSCAPGSSTRCWCDTQSPPA